ncbi:hypothetical protein GCM10020001_006890 [Nonomuraea salmonea]
MTYWFQATGPTGPAAAPVRYATSDTTSATSEIASPRCAATEYSSTIPDRLDVPVP